MRLGIKKRFPYIKLLSVSAASLVLVLLSVYAIRRIEPIFRVRAADTSTQIIRECIDEISSEIMSDSAIIEKYKLTENNISIFDVNTFALNRIRTEFSIALSEKLSQTHYATIYITLGSITGYSVFQGLGFRIPVKIYFGSISAVDINDEFISAGINQTKYRANIDISVSASVVSSLFSDSRDIKVSLPICERIMVGNVPNYYIHGKG